MLLWVAQRGLCGGSESSLHRAEFSETIPARLASE